MGLTVNELRTVPLERLIGRMHHPRPAESDPEKRRLYEEATQPELQEWIERNQERAKLLTADEIEELLSLQGTGGPLTSFGVEHFVTLIERKRGLMDKVQTIAGTEYIDFLEQFVDLLYDKVQPYGDRREHSVAPLGASCSYFSDDSTHRAAGWPPRWLDFSPRQRRPHPGTPPAPPGAGLDAIAPSPASGACLFRQAAITSV